MFSNESVLCIRWPKYWNFSISISPSNECSGPISLRMDWLDLLAVQGTLKSLLQHHSSKISILQCSTFFVVQLSHPYIATEKTIALTRRIFFCKVMSLIFNMLSILAMTFESQHITKTVNSEEFSERHLAWGKKNKRILCLPLLYLAGSSVLNIFLTALEIIYYFLHSWDCILCFRWRRREICSDHEPRVLELEGQ